MDDNITLGRWISILHRQFQIYINKELKDINVTSSEFAYIVNLEYGESENQQRLANLIDVDPSLTTRSLNSLKEKGYINKEQDENDKRNIKITLTKKGNEVKPIILKALYNWTVHLGSNIDDIDKFMKQIEMMADNAKGLNNEKN